MKRLLAVFLLLAMPAFAQSNIELLVLDATVKDKTVSGADVIFQKQGQSSVSTKTNAAGKISIPAPFGADDASVMMIIRKEGYSPLAVQCPCDDLVYAVSPVMQELDGMRFVLSWGAAPEDLDSYLVYQTNVVYFDTPNGPDVHLDVDDTDGYGPETITLEKRAYGVKYLYGVRDYTNKGATASAGLSDVSRAKVFVYIGSTLIKTYDVPQGKRGNLWIPFYVDEYGNIVDVDTMHTVEFAADFMRELGETIVAGQNVVPEDRIKLSKEKNAAGEKEYHAKSYNNAINLYWEAINLDPNNGQAYSNLGLAYQRTGDTAEALWANRKAIDLAHGANTNTIQASSYYNIARIYEAQGAYRDALQNYEWALEKRNHQAYHDGIARMKEKLK